MKDTESLSLCSQCVGLVPGSQHGHHAPRQPIQIQQLLKEEKTPSPENVPSSAHDLLGQEPILKAVTDEENGIIMIGSLKSSFTPGGKIGYRHIACEAPSREGGWTQPQNQSSCRYYKGSRQCLLQLTSGNIYHLSSTLH